jgi:hypothetical protein
MAGAGPSPEERAAFLKRFARFGSEASVETYTALFHPEARLFDDGMERPLRFAEIPDHIAGVLALVRGFRMDVERWRARGRVVFVEAYNTGEVAGRRVAWRAVYRLELDGGRVRDGRRYFDRAPLLAALDPTRPSAPAPEAPGREAAGEAVAAGPDSPEQLAGRFAAAWGDGRPEALAAAFREDAALFAPDVARPLGRGEVAAHYRRLAARLGGGLSLRRWAGDDALLFLEWEGSAPRGEAPPAGGVERLDLQGGRVLAARSYFDTTAAAFAARADTV